MKMYELKMTKTEVKPISLEVLDMQELETVSSANAVHTPPSGEPLTIAPTVASPYINVLLGPFALAGFHIVRIQAVCSNGSKPEVIYQIQVD